ncbi:hypothetical protein T06_2022 [Trichinella sp. T6]|nr:hypothetical protein T06_2022 [Trichinella sp. T6]
MGSTAGVSFRSLFSSTSVKGRALRHALTSQKSVQSSSSSSRGRLIIFLCDSFTERTRRSQ